MNFDSAVLRLVAGTFSVCALVTFAIPTLIGLLLLTEDGNSQPSSIIEFFLPVFSDVSDEGPLAFFRNYWTMLPTLLGGALLALPRTRVVAGRLLVLLMLFVGVGGTIYLQWEAPEPVLRSVAYYLGNNPGVVLDSFAELRAQIESTREIALPFLAAMVGAAISLATVHDSVHRQHNAALLLIAVLFIGLPGKDVHAAEVKILVIPRGELENVNQFIPKVAPVDFLEDMPDQNTLDEVNNRWSLSIKPLDRFLTDLTVGLENEGGQYPDPPIKLSLPYRDAEIEVVLPLTSDQLSRQKVDAAYRNGPSKTNNAELLSDFLAANAAVEYLTSGVPAEQVSFSVPLGRSLIVYSEAMFHLVSETEWFGIPSDIERKASILRTLTDRFGDNEISIQINLTRLRAAQKYVERMESLLYSRIWEAIRSIDQLKCHEKFPLSYSFYKHLKIMDKNRYENIRGNAKFTRTQVLLASSSCFREFVSREGSRRYIRPSVVRKALAGSKPSDWIRELTVNLTTERDAIYTESGRDRDEAECGTEHEYLSESTRRSVEGICDSIVYFADLEALLIRDYGNDM